MSKNSIANFGIIIAIIITAGITGNSIAVQYGRGGEPREQWNFGTLNKGLLDKKNVITKGG